MVAADVASCVLSLGLPLLWLTHTVTYPIVLGLELLLAAVGVVRFAAQTPVLTGIVAAGDLVDANGKLAGTRSATDIGGQGLAGVILSFVAAPVALLVNAAAYAVSALLLARIRPIAAPPDQTRPQETSSARWRELGPIVTRVLRRFDVATFCGIGLVNGLMNAVFLLYVVHDLQMSGNVIAFSIGTGALGGVLGGSIAGRVEHHIGGGWTVTIGALSITGSVLPLLLAQPGLTAILATIAYEFTGALGGTLLMAATYGAVLSATTHPQMSRTMAVMSNAGSTASILGLTIGGILGTTLTLHTTVTIATLVSAAIGAAALTSTLHPRAAISPDQDRPA